MGHHSPPPSPPPPGPYHRPPHRRRGSLLELFSLLIVCVVFIAVANTISSTSITSSTIEREKLDSQYVVTTNYYEDHLGWVESGSRLESGMKAFFKETGVQPYLYLTETINGETHPSDEEMKAFAESLYDELFEDEGHLLVVFQEYNSNGDYFCWTVAGRQAKTVFDDEARDIFFDYLDSYYYSDKDTSDFFSATFRDTGERMMEVTQNPWVKVVIIIVIAIIIYLLFQWWQKAKEQKNLEAEQAERILNTPIDNLSSTSDLENKYK